jgi:DNA-directed RNA polymerase subunit H (RpoH/RPB5)
MHRSDFQKLLDIKKTQIEMVSDRGYEITPEEQIISSMNLDSFIDYLNGLAQSLPKGTVARSLLSRSYLVKNEKDETVRSMLVYYAGRTQTTQKQITVEVVRDFIRTVQRYGINEAILIVDAQLSSIGETELSALTLTKWQVFFDNELTYNPTIHVDNQRHELIAPDLQQEKLRELKVDKSKLLILKASDPIVRYYGWTAGNLIRIHRIDTVVSILAPKSSNYRIIVD